MINKKTAATVLLWGAVITAALFLAAYAHGATTSTQKHGNSLGFVQYDANPYLYNAGSIIEVTNVDGNINLRFKPLGTFALYDEPILLCGLPVEKFEGIRDPMLLTYDRVSHHAVNGVGCHDLIRADNLLLKPGLR